MRLRVALALVLAATMTTPAWAAVTENDLAEAAERLARAQERADELTREYEAALAESYRLEQTLGRLALSVQELDMELGETRELVADRAVEIYMSAAGGRLSSLMVAGSLDDAGAGLGYLNAVAGRDLALVRGLEAAEADLDRQRAELDGVRADHEMSVAQLEATASTLLLELQVAQTEYRDLVAQRQAELEEARRRAEEEARRQAEAEAAARAATSTTTTSVVTETSEPAAEETTTTTSDSTTTTSAESTTTTTTLPAATQTCPVDGPHSFTDTWGAPRSGGRSHRGVDMLAARGTPLVAIEAGTLSRLSNSSLGGITIWLRGTSGDTFYYAHLDSWAAGIYEGMSVSVGDLVGYVGTTGNAPSHIPHLHFEYHPGGGGAVNPTPLVTSLCR